MVKLVGQPIKKPSRMVKKKKVKPVDYKKLADRLLQELGRKVYNSCEICGGEYSCLHHAFYKSESTVLRYDWNNCVPICVKCHFKIHNTKGNLTASKITANRGAKWLYELEVKAKEGAGQHYGMSWYREKAEELKLALE